MHRSAPVARVGRYLVPHRRRLLAALVCVAAEAALGVVPILVFKALVDRLSAPEPTTSGLAGLVLMALAAIIGATGLSVAATYLVQATGKDVALELRRQLFGHLLLQSGSFYTRTRGGELLSRIVSDVGALDTVLSTTVLATMRHGLAAASTLIVMVVLDWRLAALSLVLLPLVALPTRTAGRRMRRRRDAVQRQLGHVTAYLQETLGVSGVLLVRAFGRQPAERDRFDALIAELRRRDLALAMTSRWFTATLSLLQVAGPVVLLLVGSLLVVRGEASLGTVVAFATVIAARLGGAVNGLALGASSAIASFAVWERLFAVLDERPDVVEAPDARTLQAPRGEVELQGVSFTYPGQERPAVCDFDLAVRPGQLVALVGPSGAGKTTTSALIARLIDPDAGVVRLDGHDVRELTFASLSAAIGVVLQDSFLFHASLRDNLRYGRPDATDADLQAAVRAAELEDVVARLPEGLDTRVGERGVHLSGGERQRVALARVLLKDPPVLVLDEATSHLDTLAEQRVQRALREALRGRTALVIAHRLSTVRAADVIVVLDRGRIVERGTHEQLVAAGGLYARLHDADALAAVRRG